MSKRKWKPGDRVQFVCLGETHTGVIVDVDAVDGLKHWEDEEAWVNVHGHYWHVQFADLERVK